MKKMVALLTTVMILAGSVGMTASAATTSTCTHAYLDRVMGDEYITTSTHSVQVGKTSNGTPILATCIIETKWQKYSLVCTDCQAVRDTGTIMIYEVHSMHD